MNREKVETTTRLQLAIDAIRLANEYAFTFDHPAYRDAEAKMMALSSAEAETAINATGGGLKDVIGRGIIADGDKHHADA